MAVVSSYFIFVKESVITGVLILSAFILLFIVLPIIVCAIKRKDKLKTAFIFSAVIMILSAAAFLRFYSITSNYKKADLKDPVLTVSGKVDSVEYFGGGENVILSSVVYSGRLNGGNGYKISVNIYGDGAFDVGDVISFTAVVEDKFLFYEGVFRASDLERGVKYYASVDALNVEKTGESLTVFDRVNVAVRDQLSKGLDKDEFTVAYALLLGNSEYSESDVLSSYRKAGVAHIFAVSGLHIGFLAAVLGFIFKKTRINPYLSAVIICAVLFFYSGVCGFSASSIRATVMCASALFVSASGNRYDGLTALSLAAVIIILISPVQLFCAGFVLSFSVALGIMIAAKPIGKIFKFLPDKAAFSIGAVAAAWLFSAPVLIIFFKELSLFSVISNLIFIPVVCVIYVFLLISVILSFISPAVFLFIPSFVLSVINAAVSAIDYEPFIIGGITLTASTVFYYAALIVPTGLFNVKKATKILLSAVFAVIFGVSATIYNVRENNTVKAYVSGSYGICATVVEGKDERAVIISFVKDGFPVGRLKRIFAGGGKDTDVIVTSAADVNFTVTRLSALSKVRSVYYYSGDNGYLSNSFKGVNFIETGDDSVLYGDYVLSFKEKGRAVEVSAGEKSILVFSEFKSDSADFSENKKRYEMIVAYDYLERIAATYNYSVFLSYRNSLAFTDAERSGNYLFKFA